VGAQPEDYACNLVREGVYAYHACQPEWLFHKLSKLRYTPAQKHSQMLSAGQGSTLMVHTLSQWCATLLL
jgi:hypothetical protein